MDGLFPRFSLKGMFTQGPHDGQQRHGRVNESFSSREGNNLDRELTGT